MAGAASAAPPVFYLLAGPNGAGKSTLYKALVLAKTVPAKLEFVNADLHEARHLQKISDAAARSEAARAWADARRALLLQAGKSFISETVFSHPSKLQLIADAQAAGFQVVLLVVALDDQQQLLARVSQRVREGGHDVLPERILQRYPRTLANLKLAVRQADAALLYDSHAVEAGTHRMVAICKGAATKVLVKELPRWAQQVLGQTGPH